MSDVTLPKPRRSMWSAFRNIVLLTLLGYGLGMYTGWMIGFSETSAQQSAILAQLKEDPRQYGLVSTTVIDGDTIRADIALGLDVVLDNQSIRVAGVDCPELRTQEGKAARAFTVGWVQSSRVLVLKTSTRERDKYGRLLGEVWNDRNENLGEALFKAGYAKPLLYD